jgi:hypothetical protein
MGATIAASSSSLADNKIAGDREKKGRYQAASSHSLG